MTGKESPRPEQSGTQRLLLQALAATVLFLALLAGVVAAGAGLSGNWSVSTAWNRAAPQEYGFFSNVNPAVDHPRWSQATERRIGEDGLFAKKRKTLLFNGYEAQVGQLYTGMDLQKYF